MEEIRSLSDVGFEALYAAHEEAFKDYERKWTKEEYARMLHRRGYMPALSFGAFEGGKLVGFTLNGIGSFNGVQTAYDTGTGTIPEYRGRGLAGKIFEASIPHLQAAGIQQYLLEVLQHNTAAVKIYDKAGFKVVRELGYFIQAGNKLTSRLTNLPAEISLREMILSGNEMRAMWDFHPSWQNSFDAVAKVPEHFVTIGAFDGNKLVGYGTIEKASGDIPQLAVDKAYRRRGIATVFLSELMKHNEADVVRIINIDANYEPMTAFLGANGISLSGKQFEMVRDLQ